MEIDRRRKFRAVNFTIAVVGLAMIAAGLVVMIVITAGQAGQADQQVRKALARLALLSMALLGLTVVVLVWIVLHNVLERISLRKQQSTTPYVDAWTEAGRRLELTDEDQPDTDEEGHDE